MTMPDPTTPEAQENCSTCGHDRSLHAPESGERVVCFSAWCRCKGFLQPSATPDALVTRLAYYHKDMCEMRYPHMIMAPRLNQHTPIWRPRVEGDRPHICTCGLAEALAALQATTQEEKKDVLFLTITSVTNRHKQHFATEGIRDVIEEELVEALLTRWVESQEEKE
jgi:hypothetical protein